VPSWNGLSLLEKFHLDLAGGLDVVAWLAAPGSSVINGQVNARYAIQGRTWRSALMVVPRRRRARARSVLVFW